MPLFERVGRNLRLTAAAQQLVLHADVILAHVEEAEADLQATADLITGTVRVAAIQSAGLYLLAPALRKLAQRAPGAARGGDRRRARDLDALARARQPRHGAGRPVPVPPARAGPAPGPRAAARGALPHRAAASSTRWRDQDRVPIAALKDEPWAIGKEDTAYAELTIRACRTFGGFEPDVRHRSNDLLMLLALVSNGQAVTLLPDLVRADREPSVVTRDVAEAPLTRTVFGAIRHGSARRPALNALRAALRDTAAGLRSAATPAPGSLPAPGRP